MSLVPVSNEELGIKVKALKEDLKIISTDNKYNAPHTIDYRLNSTLTNRIFKGKIKNIPCYQVLDEVRQLRHQTVEENK